MAIKKKFIGADQVDQSKVLLDNNSALRAKNAAGTAVEILKLDGSDSLKLLKIPQVASDPSAADDLVRKAYVDSEISASESGLQSQITTLDGELSSEISRATAAEEALDGRLDIVEPKVTTLESEMDAVEGRATSLEGRMTTAEGDIDSLEGRATSLEGRMDSAESSLATKAATSYVDSQLALKLDSAEVGVSVAQLVSGKIPLTQVPAIAITDVEIVSTVAERDALVIGSGDGEIQEGDVCVVTGESKSYIYTGSAWQELLHPAYDPSGVQSQLDSLDGRLDVAEGDIDSLEGRMSTAESDINAVELSIATEQTARESADSALDGRLDIIEGIGEGSVAKAEQDAKDYADSLIATEQAARESGDNALDARLDVIEGSGAGSVAKAQADAQSYADGLIATEQAARIAGDDALDARLDVLEGSGAGSLAQTLQDSKDYTDSEIAALTTSDIEEGSNLYFTDARAQQASVEDAIQDGVTAKAPSQNAVFDALALKLDTALKGAANGLAELGSDGKIPTAQLPALAITDVHVVANIAARDALVVEEGDVAKVTNAGSGLPKTYIYDGSSWVEIESGSDVDSVNGQTGNVVLDTDDVSEGATNLYFTNARAKSAAVADQLSDGITDVAPSQNAVYDAIQSEQAARVAGDASTLVDAKAYTDAQLDTLVIQQQNYESKTLASGDVTNGYIDVSGPIQGTPWVMVDGIMGRPGTDFTHSGSRITFQSEWAVGGVSALAAGDVVHVFFMKNYNPFA